MGEGSLRPPCRKCLQGDGGSLGLSQVWVRLTISSMSNAALVVCLVSGDGLCGLGRPAYVSLNPKASCSWCGMASDMFLQALWLSLRTFLYYLTQMNICQCHPEELWKLWCTLPASFSPRGPGILALPSWLLKAQSHACLNVPVSSADKRSHSDQKPLGRPQVEQC